MADGIALDPGFRFRPSDDGLITLFLRPKIAEEPFEERIVNNADVYSEDPAELVAQHTRVPGTQGNTSVWYFFCPPRYTSKRASSGGRRQRAVGGGGGGGESVWKSEGGKKPVKDADGRRVGYLQKFSYGVYESSGSARTFTRLGWCMTEYSLDDDAVGAEKQVLCKVYRSPRAVCAEARTEAAGSPCSGSKRKADAAVGDLSEEAPPSARPRQEAGSEHEQPNLPPAEPLPTMEVAGGGSEDEFLQTEQQQPELQLDFDLEGMEALLSSPVDENLTRQFSTTTDEQCMRYLFHDEPLPCAPTVEVAGAGIEDGLIQTEHEKTQSPPAFYLEGVLPAPTDQNLIGQSSTAMEEQCTRYLFDDDIDVPWPWTSTSAEVVDGGRGDERIQTEHEHPQSPLDFDLEGVLPAPTDQNLIGQSSTAMEEQCTRYLFDEDIDMSWPWTPTAAKVVDGARGDRLIQTEHEQPQSPPEFDLEGVLPAPMDQNLIGQSSTAMEEQCTRYPFDDDIDVPCPWTSTPAEVVDGGRGDELIQTANGLRADADIITLLAAGQTVDDIFGADQ